MKALENVKLAIYLMSFKGVIKLVKKIADNDEVFINKIKVIEFAFTKETMDKFFNTIDYQVELGNIRATIEGRTIEAGLANIGFKKELDTLEQFDEVYEISLAAVKYVEKYGQLVA